MKEVPKKELPGISGGMEPLPGPRPTDSPEIPVYPIPTIPGPTDDPIDPFSNKY